MLSDVLSKGKLYTVLMVAAVIITTTMRPNAAPVRVGSRTKTTLYKTNPQAMTLL